MGGIFAGILGHLLGGSDWKNTLIAKGEQEAKKMLRKMAWDKLNHQQSAAKVCKHMRDQDFQWGGKGAEFLKMNDEGLGEGFKISRHMIYDALKELGVPGGAVRDGIRDAVDNGVWSQIQTSCPTGTPLETVFQLSVDGLFDKELGHGSR